MSPIDAEQRHPAGAKGRAPLMVERSAGEDQ